MGIPALVRGVRGSGASGPPWGTILAIGFDEIAPSSSGGPKSWVRFRGRLDKSSILPPRRESVSHAIGESDALYLVAVRLRAVWSGALEQLLAWSRRTRDPPPTSIPPWRATAPPAVPATLLPPPSNSVPSSALR